MGQPEKGLRKLVLRGAIAAQALPGQFVHIQVGSALGYDPLLRRPISIAKIDRDRQEITLLYKVVGKGTQLLAQKRTGEMLDIMGPLGRGFSLPESGELWLVAGGIGIFPLYALAQQALEKGIPIRLFWGGESSSFLESAGLGEWQDQGIKCHLSTVDGSIGHQGFITQILCDCYAEFKEGNPQTPVKVASCGPHGMVEALASVCRELNISTEVSLEERMGCAVGACLGCVCTLRTAGGELIRKKVCQDGPVFNGEEVVWDAPC